jgi:glycosyltransferase involved in cell wall biosynthesis
MTGALRILVVANLPPWVLGGAENQVARLVEVWSRLGHHVEVAGHRIANGEATLGAAVVRTHRIAVIDGLGRALRAASYFVSMAVLLARIGRSFDVIYTRGLGDGAVSICLLKAAGFLRVPLVACPINARGAGDANFVRSIPGWRQIVGAIDRHCDAINVIAPAIEKDIERLGISMPRLSRIPNGISLLAPIVRSSASGPRRLIWTGRLAPQKGLDRLMTALARVMASGRAFSVEIVGDGPEAAALAVQCRGLALEKVICFVGHCHRDDIRARLAAADAFILPSLYEGMSNAGLEAMEAGLPVILTRCGGLDTYVGKDMGWVCEPGNLESLANALIDMLDTPERELLNMGHRCRALVEREFEIGVIGQRNAELLGSVVRTVRAR